MPLLRIAAPAVLRDRDALSSSGQVNVFAWGDYIQDNMIEKFKADTGITINLSTFGSNDEAEQKLKAAGGSGFDVIFPSVTNIPNYRGDGDDFLLAAIDESRINMDNIISSMVRDSIQLGGVQRGKRLGLPFDWGTEAVTFNSSVLPMADDEVSFGSLWGDGLEGKAAFRQKSIIMGTGLYLDAIGEVPSNRMLDVYKTEDDAKRVWEGVTAFVIENKKNIGAFWNNATEATNAFTEAGCRHRPDLGHHRHQARLGRRPGLEVPHAHGRRHHLDGLDGDPRRRRERGSGLRLHQRHVPSLRWRVSLSRTPAYNSGRGRRVRVRGRSVRQHLQPDLHAGITRQSVVVAGRHALVRAVAPSPMSK